MQKPIRIQELCVWETENLRKRKNFNHAKPTECNNCDYKGNFEERLFNIQNLEESDKGILRIRMKREYGIEGYIFRTDGRRTILHAGFCPKCRSTNVMFDIDIKE